jgi:hypothetical protein
MEIFPPFHLKCNAISKISCLFIFLLLSGQVMDLRFSVEYNWFKQVDYQSYLQYPDNTMYEISDIIVGDAKADDEKAEKIFIWVFTNFKYEVDLSSYNEFEHWAKPIDSLKIMKGDCEDGAFLIHSLLLHANIKPENIRSHGGLVKTYKLKNGKKVFDKFAGHSWTTYKRKSDGKWIALDWCNDVGKKSIKELTSVNDDHDYVHSYITFNLFGDVQTNKFLDEI